MPRDHRNGRVQLSKAPIIILVAAGLAVAGGLMAFAPKDTGPEITKASATMVLARSALGGGQIIDGAPQESGSGKLGVVKDDGAYAAIWECTPGKFSWTYGWDEIVYLLEGQVTLTHNGQSQEVRAGDLVTFHAGSRVIWDIHEKVRKVAFFHHPSRLDRVRKWLASL
jgi:uncharacterized protein